jgi:hypothetical protein
VLAQLLSCVTECRRGTGGQVDGGPVGAAPVAHRHFLSAETTAHSGHPLHESQLCVAAPRSEQRAGCGGPNRGIASACGARAERPKLRSARRCMHFITLLLHAIARPAGRRWSRDRALARSPGSKPPGKGGRALAPAQRCWLRVRLPKPLPDRGRRPGLRPDALKPQLNTGFAGGRKFFWACGDCRSDQTFR